MTTTWQQPAGGPDEGSDYLPAWTYMLGGPTQVEPEEAPEPPALEPAVSPTMARLRESMAELKRRTAGPWSG